MNIILRLLINAAIAYFLQWLLSGVHMDSFGTAIIFAIVLGLLNTFVKPVFKILSLPINVLTFGLFSLVINAGVILLVANFIDGVEVDGFIWALIFSVLLSFCSSILAIGDE